MLDRIKQILINQKNIDDYLICENKIEANELFFIKKNVDMDRAKSVHHYKVTVYIDYEEAGSKYKGSSSTNIYPTMSDAEIKKAIDEVAFAAKFVKNPHYPLVMLSNTYQSMEESNFSKQCLPYWMNEITKAIYKNDIYEKGGINSCEIFLDKITTRIVNSEGVDVQTVGYKCMIEFVTTWKEDSEEIELYRCINCSDFDAEVFAEEVKNMITICKEKAIAKNTPVLKKIPVLLTKEAVKGFFSYYYAKSNASSVYNQTSTWKVGDLIQGEEVKGDLITMTLDPFMKNSTDSRSFDGDGFPLEKVTIIDKGVLERYAADTRHAHYLEVAPTGAIHNIIVNSGKYTVAELKKEPHLEAAAFSDFTVDELTGDFCGEIRLAWYFDGVITLPVTGGSITGNIDELHNELYLSEELQKDNDFEGPKAVKLLNATVAGIE
ncbi:MAG: metallopeptidase TldD-related protein [Mobilitalea sp.]